MPYLLSPSANDAVKMYLPAFLNVPVVAVISVYLPSAISPPMPLNVARFRAAPLWFSPL